MPLFVTRFAVVAGVFLIVSTATAYAEVTAGSPTGFSLKLETTVALPPEDTFRHLVQIGRWWSPQHTYSGDAAMMSLDARPGGCFCETLPGGGFVRHMAVVYSAPGKVLRLEGGLGPLQAMGASGVLSFSLKPNGSGRGTHVTLTYTVSGFAGGEAGLDKIAPAVDGVLSEQLARFRQFAETRRTPP